MLRSLWAHGMNARSAEEGSVLRIRQVATAFVVAVVLNYPWERVQSQFYVGPNGTDIAWWVCVVASLVDGLLVLLILGVGRVVFGRSDWYEQAGLRGYLVMLASGVAISVGIEWTAIYLLRWWSYSTRMPLMPILNIGLTPLIQMLVLPPLIFRLVAGVSRYVCGPPRQSMRIRIMRAESHEDHYRGEIRPGDRFNPVRSVEGEEL